MPKGSNKFRDLTGRKFNRWTVLCRGDNQATKVMWECVCDCGTIGRVCTQNLTAGISKSCGCWNRETARLRRLIHGMSKSKEFRVWQLMLNRCLNPKAKEYPRYGARGIKVCLQWKHSFSAFLADMGRCPAGKTIDRINNNGDYEPTNCRWATNEEQQRNKRNNRVIEGFGSQKLLVEWAENLRMSASLLHYHLARGKSIEEVAANRA